jgi:hypothetical protein
MDHHDALALKLRIINIKTVTPMKTPIDVMV